MNALYGERQRNQNALNMSVKRPAEDLNAFSDGAITQGSWLDFWPTLKAMYEGGREMLGVAPSERLVNRIRDVRSPVLRPQNAFEWADWGAGTAAEGLQTGLAAADLAGLAVAVGPAAGRRFMNAMVDQRGQVGNNISGLTPALRLPDGKIYTGTTHGDAGNMVIDYLQGSNIQDKNLLNSQNWEPGFLDKTGKFLTRKEAGGLHSVNTPNYKYQLLSERQGMIDKIKGIKSDYDEMISQSRKITKKD